MLYDPCTIVHVKPGKVRAKRLEVTFQHEGREYEGYLWAEGMRGELVGSLLVSAIAGQTPLRVTTKTTTWGEQILWADGVETPAKVLAFPDDDIDSRDKPCACDAGPHEACPRHGIAASNARQNRYWQRVGGHD